MGTGEEISVPLPQIELFPLQRNENRQMYKELMASIGETLFSKLGVLKKLSARECRR